MANTIKVSFWLHRSKENNQGKVPVQIRLIYQAKKVDKATGFYVIPERWNTKKQRLKGGNEVEQAINNALDSFYSKVTTHFNQALILGDIYLPEILGALFASPQEELTLLATIDAYNKELKERVGNDYTFSTYEKYEFMADKVRSFMQSRKLPDPRLKDLTTKFIVDFDHYLRAEENNQHNTAVKYCVNLKRIINVAVLKGLLLSNPFNKYKTVFKDTEQVYLDETELDTLRKARLLKPKHIIARDLFVFQANTGLAFTDLAKLEAKDITSSDGQRWIIKPRQKTDVIATIPIMPEAECIIDKYKGQTHRKGFLFPTVSVQKYNKSLGEIADLIGLSKKISSHVGRRTFGNVALARGVSLNVISKVLGHSNTLITQRVYAHTTQKIISQEMDKWK